MSTFNTRMTRGQTKVLTLTVRDSANRLVDLSKSRAYFAMRADIKVNPSVTLDSTISWAGLGVHLINDVVINASNVYVCITAGTSAASGGPTTTSADITDGTVHWKYLGTDAAYGWRHGIIIAADQVGSTKGQFTITLIPSDTINLVALGDDDPWIWESWIIDNTIGTVPVVDRSNMGLYPQVTNSTTMI